MEIPSQPRLAKRRLVWLLASVILVAAAALIILALSANAGRGTRRLASAIQTNHTLEISPDQGGPGTPIRLAGQGWHPNDTLFLRIQDPQHVTGAQLAAYNLAIVPASGSFTAEFVLPFDLAAPGATQVNLTIWSPVTGDRASRPFRVLSTDGSATPAELPLTGADVSGTGTPGLNGTAVALPANLTTVASTGANLLAGPGTAYPVLASLGGGVRVSVLGQNDGGDWLYAVVDNGPEGWLLRSDTSYGGEARVLPSPSLPSPTAVPTETPGAAALPAATSTPSPAAWHGEYYQSPDLSGAPMARREDSKIDFAWGSASPAPGIPAGNFSVRWTRQIVFAEGVYRFHALVHDGVRVYVDNNPVIDQWQDGPQRELVGDIWLAPGAHDLRVEYYDRANAAFISLSWEPVPAPVYPNWKGEYWANQELSGIPSIVRNELSVDFQWSSGGPAANLPRQHFSARWSRWFNFDLGVYRFTAQADDGVRVYLDGKRIIDQWHDSGGTDVYSAQVVLPRGGHSLVVEYYQATGPALARFGWSYVGPVPATATPVPPSATPATPPPSAPGPVPTATPFLAPPPAPSSTPAPTSPPATRTDAPPTRGVTSTPPPAPTSPPATSAPPPTSPPPTSAPAPTSPPATSAPPPTSPPATSAPPPTSPPATTAPSTPVPEPTKAPRATKPPRLR